MVDISSTETQNMKPLNFPQLCTEGLYQEACTRDATGDLLLLLCSAMLSMYVYTVSNEVLCCVKTSADAGQFELHFCMQFASKIQSETGTKMIVCKKSRVLT